MGEVPVHVWVEQQRQQRQARRQVKEGREALVFTHRLILEVRKYYALQREQGHWHVCSIGLLCNSSVDGGGWCKFWVQGCKICICCHLTSAVGVGLKR